MTPRASSISRLLKQSWGNDPFPFVTQMGDTAVMIESPHWRTLGWAADTLAKDGRYLIVHGGQWLSDTQWDGWLEVRCRV